MHEPDVVILAETTSGLDPRAARTVRDTITELAAGDRTVFHEVTTVDAYEEGESALMSGERVGVSQFLNPTHDTVTTVR